MHQLCVFITLNCSLQEKATKWQENREIDGLTTNGVLIMHPRGSFCGGEAKCGMWREVSVGGGVFSMRESRSAQQKGVVVSVNIVPENRELLPTWLLFFVRLVLISSCRVCPDPSNDPNPFRFPDWHFLRISLRVVSLHSSCLSLPIRSIYSPPHSLDSLGWNTKWHTHTKPQKNSLPSNLYVLPFFCRSKKPRKCSLNGDKHSPVLICWIRKDKEKGMQEKLVPAESS